MTKATFPIKSFFSLDEIERNWRNWVWQEQNAIQTVSGLLELFPNLSENQRRALRQAERHFRFKLTPYMLSLVQVGPEGVPVENDPIWQQFVPTWDAVPDLVQRPSDLAENWELPEDMVNPILQHKYTNRVNFRIQNSCLAYCMYCFEAKRVLDRRTGKGSFSEGYFEESLEYIKSHEEIEEVVISGGEPLLLSNDKLDYILRRIRAIKHIFALRIQTRAFVHNPFRIDEGFVELLKKHDVTAIGIHITHPAEISNDFRDAIEIITRCGLGTLLLAQTPLLKGINDDADVLRQLFMTLYRLKVKPYYLLHAMPYTLGSSFRTSVRRGVDLLKSIKRHISNPAVPEYVIVHSKGKHTVPAEPLGTSEFHYANGKIEFSNWKGEWCIYDDASDF